MDKVTIALSALVVMFAVYMGLQILELDKENAAIYDGFCKANGCQQLVAMDTTPYCYNCPGMGDAMKLCMNVTGGDCFSC